MLVYTTIINGNVEETLEKVCEIICQNNEELEILEEEFVLVCNYVGMHMDITHAAKWIDILEEVRAFIHSPTIAIDRTLQLCYKMCIVCRNLHETKQMSVKKLRDHVIKHFDSKNINHYQLGLFEKVLPSVTNESYNIACNIVATFCDFLVRIEGMDPENKDMFHLSNHFRSCIEYITRRDVYIENGLNRDCDCIWFLWGVLTIMCGYNDNTINTSHELFKFKWKQSIKKKRIGILWGSIFIVILSRKHIDNTAWSLRELKVFDKVRSMSERMVSEVRQRILTSQKKESDNNLNVLVNYTPKIKEENTSQRASRAAQGDADSKRIML